MIRTIRIFLAALLFAVLCSCTVIREQEPECADGIDVVLTASIGDPTKGISLSDERVHCEWTAGEQVTMRDDNLFIGTLTVTQISGTNAILSGKANTALTTGTDVTLYYAPGGAPDIIDYSGQTGTAESAVSHSYLLAHTTVKALEGNTMTLESATFEYGPAFCRLSFFKGPDPLKVKRITVTTPSAGTILKQFNISALTSDFFDNTDNVGDNPYTIAVGDEGASTVYFALESLTSASYTFKLTDIDDNDYLHDRSGTILISNYYSGEWILAKTSATVALPSAISDLVYTGSPQDLVTAGTVSEGCTLYYMVTDDLTQPAEDNPGWKATLPKGTKAGTYNVWTKVVGNAYYNTEVLPTPVTVVIGKAATFMISYPVAVATTLTYNNTDQTLVTGATAGVGGVPYYFVSTSSTVPSTTSEGWTTSPTAKNAGHYYIWTWCKGDDNHKDMDDFPTAPVEKDIEKAVGTLSIDPTSLTFAATDAAFTTKNISASRNSTGDISAVSSDDTKASVTVSGTTITVKRETALSAPSVTITVSVADDPNYTTPSPVYCTVSMASVVVDAASAVVGKVIGRNGQIYDNMAAAETAGSEAVAMVAYVSGGHGLAIALQNDGGQCGYADAETAATGWNASAPFSGSTWRLPTVADWLNMFEGCGSLDYTLDFDLNSDSGAGHPKSYGNIKTILTGAGGTEVTNTYWTGSEYDATHAWFVDITSTTGNFNFEEKATTNKYTRPVLAF